jgi:tetratricopeptide (TPR) repeat protein
MGHIRALLALLALVSFASLQCAPAPAQDTGRPMARDVSELLVAAQDSLAAGDFAESKATLDRIIGLRLLSPNELGLVLYLRGQASYEQGNLADARADWDRALRDGELPEAQRAALEQTLAALDARPGQTPTRQDVNDLVMQANEAYASGDLNRATELSERVLAAVEGGEQPALEAISLVMLGMAAMTRGEASKAHDYLERAVALADTPGVPASMVLAIYSGYAEAAVMLGRFDEATDRFEQALALTNLSETSSQRGNLLSRLGMTELSLSELDAAYDHLLEALQISEAQGGMGAQRGVLPSLALTAHIRGDAALADEYIAKHQSAAEAAGFSDRGARELESFGAWSHSLDWPDSACWLEGQAVAAYRSAGMEEDAEILEEYLAESGCADAGAPR